MLLLTLNHQILISTKASRICTAPNGKDVLEFGSRRAQGYSGAIYGARASIIGGCIATSCTISEKNLIYLHLVLWLTVGFKCLIQNMKHSKHGLNIHPKIVFY